MSNQSVTPIVRSFSIHRLCLAVLLAGSVGIAQADYSWRFDAGTSATIAGTNNEDFIVWDLNTLASSVTTSTSSSNVAFNAHVSLSGSGTVNDSFTIRMEAGFAYNPASPSYDTTDYATAANNTIRFVLNAGIQDGVSPWGSGGGFTGYSSTASEILHFTISGLGAGHLFQVKGYELKDNNAERIDLYYGAGLTRYDTLLAIEDVSSLNILLGNGDQFGFGYNFASGNRSALKGVRFDIVPIPEPATAALLGLGLLGQLLAWRRRC